MELLAAISYDPQIRGFLIVLVAGLALCGSTYLLVATNTGARLGFLLAAAGLMGFMTVLAVVWTAYGIGPSGDAPSWEVEAVVAGDVGPTAQPVLQGFPRGWNELAETDKQRAEAQATVDETLTGDDPAVAALGFRSTGDYLPLTGYDRGGEKTSLFGIKAPRPLDFKHKPHYAVIQVQAVVTTTTTTPPPVQETQAAGSGTGSGNTGAGGTDAGAQAQSEPSTASQTEGAGTNANNPNTAGGDQTLNPTTTTVPGGATTPTTGTGVVSGQGTGSGDTGTGSGSAQANQPSDQSNTANPSTPAPVAAPAEPRADPSKPVVTLLMVRDLGARRLPPFLTAVFSGILFAILCIALHRRDKQIMKARAEAGDE